MTDNTNNHPPKSPIKILVCYHKPYPLPPIDDGVLLPIHVGKALSDADLNMQADNELNGQPCDNISDKNESYDELTAMYWAWKNLRKLYPDVKYVGLSHYRRLFAFDEDRKFTEIINKYPSEMQDYRLDAGRIINILESGRVILAKRRVFGESIEHNYCMMHNSEDYRILKRVIMEKFPDYYDSFVEFMEKNNKISLCCMFIMKWEDFEKYCEWLFAVMSEVEPLVPYRAYNQTQRRVFAFMAERLLSMYVMKNKMMPYYCSIYLYGDKRTSRRISAKLGGYLFRLIRFCRLELIFKLTNMRP